jgi:uncharacterized membrane protein YkoI
VLRKFLRIFRKEKTMKRKMTLALLAAALTTAGAAAYAANVGDNDALVIDNAKVPLSQAVTVAEQHVNGKATRAEYERGKTSWVYEVEVVKGVTVYDVTVDPEKGTVLASNADRADHEEDHDQED